jgi:hypothetical protein
MEEVFKMFFKRYFKATNIEGKVISVDKVKDTCVVKPEDGPEIPGVKLKSVISNATTKLVVYPKVDSYVTIGRLYNMELECFVAQVSEVDEIRTNCENVIYNGGDNGGLVNWPAVKDELDKTNEVVNIIKQTLGTWVPVGGDGGAALKTAFNAAIVGKNVGDFDNKEDTKVKH